MSGTIRATSPRRLLGALLTLLLALPLTLALASPASADGFFSFSGTLRSGQEVCLGPAFTEDPATDRVVVLNVPGDPASGPLQWTINRGTTSAMTDAVAVLQNTGATFVNLQVTATGFPTAFPGWFNGCIKNLKGRPVDVPQAFFSVSVPLPP